MASDPVSTADMANTQRRTKRLLIQMSGAPGAGKSTTARLLQQSLQGFVIDHDIIRSSLLEDDTGLSFDAIAKSAYNIQWRLAEDALRQGLTVIVDCVCNYKEVVARGRALAERYGCEYWYVECRVEDMAVLDARLRGREAMASQRTAVDEPPAAARQARQGEDPQARFRHWMDSPARPERNVVLVDSTGSPASRRDYILEQMGI